MLTLFKDAMLFRPLWAVSSAVRALVTSAIISSTDALVMLHHVPDRGVSEGVSKGVLKKNVSVDCMACTAGLCRLRGTCTVLLRCWPLLGVTGPGSPRQRPR